MRAVAIIPARLGSTRFAEKPLALLKGEHLINHVYKAVKDTALFDEVIVATDSLRILDAVTAAGGKAQLSKKEHPSGSDRVAEIATKVEAELIVNIQGDEPFINAAALTPLLACFSDAKVQMASLMTPIIELSMLQNPNIVKVVTDAQNRALYFSRSQIPYDRDAAAGYQYMRHIGVYAWRKDTLFHYVKLPLGKLENIEKLEQLRALEHGIAIHMVQTQYQGIGIDTPEDLIQAETMMGNMR